MRGGASLPYRRFWVLIYSTLFPRMKASPYRALSSPPTTSSVCSSAMFMYPSRQTSTPRYSTPELSLTTTGRPVTVERKSAGVRPRPSVALAAAAVVAAEALAALAGAAAAAAASPGM